MLEYGIHAPGRFSVTLRNDTPDSVRGSITERDHIIFTDERVDERRFEQEAEPTSPTSIMAFSSYTGRIMEIVGGQALDTPLILAGDHITAWLGDANGRGRIFTTKRTYENTPWSEFVADVVGNPSSPKLLELGTLTNGPENVTADYFGVTPKVALDHAAAMCGAEYRVNNDGTIDSGRRDQLYRTEQNPKCLVVRKTIGFDLSDAAFRTRPSPNMESRVDASEWVRSVYLLSSGDFAGGSDELIIGQASISDIGMSNPYRTLFGDPDPTGIVIADPQVRVDQADDRATQLLTEHAIVNKAITLDLTEFDISDDFQVGDTVWVYDPPRLMDPDAWLRYGGGFVHPTTLRITEASWSISENMGVYVRKRTGELIDVSPYVQWEVESLGAGGRTVAPMSQRARRQVGPQIGPRR